MATIDREDVEKMIDRHQSSCLKPIETSLGHMTGTLTAISNTLDAVRQEITGISLDNNSMNERLRHGSATFQTIHAQIGDIQRMQNKLQMSLWKLVVLVAASGTTGVAIAKMFIGGG
jgi:argininosuccinate lyase